MVATSDSPQGVGKKWLMRADLEQPGDVVTFYSYKGGTGRTMGLVNCAGLIASQLPSGGKPILLIDFDLEAPGLHRYLLPYLGQADIQQRPGVLELFGKLADSITKRLNGSVSRQLDDIATSEIVAEFDLSSYVIPTDLNGLQIITAGCFDADYDQRLAHFDWPGLFFKAPALFRCLGARFAQEYSYTFIDARTGLSDTSGICTMLLPNVLVVVFTPNSQSLTGIGHLVRRAIEYRETATDIRELRVYPLPSRVDNQVEHFRQVWRDGHPQHPLFGQVTGYQPLFENIFSNQLTVPDAVAKLKEYFDVVQVPHTADYAYGERLCFGATTSSDSLSIRNAFEQFLPWLLTGAQPWERPGEIALNLEADDWLDRAGVVVGPEESDWSFWFERLARVAEDIEHPAILKYAALSPDRRFDVGFAMSLAHAYREDFPVALEWVRRTASAFVDDIAASFCPEAPLRLLELWNSAPPIEAFRLDAPIWLDEINQLMSRWRPLKRDRQTWLALLERITNRWDLLDLLLQIQIEAKGESSDSALATMSMLVEENRQQHLIERAIQWQQRLVESLENARSPQAARLPSERDKLAQLRSEQDRQKEFRLPSVHECRYAAFFSYSVSDDQAWNQWVSCFKHELFYSLPSRLRGIRLPPICMGGDYRQESGFLDEKLEDNVRNSFALFVFVHDNYLESEFCLKELEFFKKHFGEKGFRERLYVVAMSREAIGKLTNSDKWKQVCPFETLHWVPFFQAARPYSPIPIYSGDDNPAEGKRLVVSNDFWNAFVHIREDLADKIRDSAVRSY